jgi:three-Cys-motif partner protein
MIAISVLKDAQQNLARRGIHRRVHCHLCERDPDAYARLKQAVATHHQPSSGFEVSTHGGSFVDAVPSIRASVGHSFSLVFIDPTGWTGYPFDTIRPLLLPRFSEVIINYMYDFINRGVSMSDQATIASFDPILGGPGWTDRLDPTLAAHDRGAAVEALFRESLKATGNFEHVVSTRIYRPTIDRPHFFLTYGTKSPIGLRTFRDTEFKALKEQAADRAAAKARKREELTLSADMFADMDAAVQTEMVDDYVASEMKRAKDALLQLLRGGPCLFKDAWPQLLQRHVIRVTNVKDICADLQRTGVLEHTWGSRRRKPDEDDVLRLK